MVMTRNLQTMSTLNKTKDKRSSKKTIKSLCTQVNIAQYYAQMFKTYSLTFEKKQV